MGLTCKELVGARFQLYRNQLLQENTRWKALAETHTMHSFAPFSKLIFCLKIAKNVANCFQFFANFVKILLAFVDFRADFIGISRNYVLS